MTAVRRAMSAVAKNAEHEFMAFTMDAETEAVTSDVISSSGLGGDVLVVSTLSDTVEYLATLPTPQILLVDMGATPDIMSAVEQLSEVCDPETRVVLLGEVNDLYLYRDLIDLGIADYLIKPLTERALTDSLQRLRKPDPVPLSDTSSEAGERQGHVIAVIGARGGAGASMVASNLAIEGAESFAKQVMLIDMDLTFGTQAVTFDVDPGAGLSDAMMEPGRMDELFIKRASTRIGERLQLMAAEADIGRGDIASVEALQALLEYVYQDADYVVIDMPRSLLVKSPAIMEQFKTVVVVAEPTLPAMRDCARLKTILNASNPTAELKVVLNKVGVGGKDELPISTFEEGGSLKISKSIHFEPKVALNAEANGKCVTQFVPRSKLSKDIKALATDLMGNAEARSNRGLGAIFGLNKLRLRKSKAETK